MDPRKTVHSTGTISETLAHRFTEQKENLESHWNKYYQLDPELARRYLEEMAAMSANQRNVRDIPREVISPSAPKPLSNDTTHDVRIMKSGEKCEKGIVLCT